MKRNQTPNISSSSLRSSSRKNLKRNSAINSGFSSKTVTKSAVHSQSSNKSRRLCTKVATSKKTIGSSSNQEFTCKGCKNTFKLYTDTKQFMMSHVKSNDAFFLDLQCCSDSFYSAPNVPPIGRTSQVSEMKLQCHQDVVLRWHLLVLLLPFQWQNTQVYIDGVFNQMCRRLLLY